MTNRFGQASHRPRARADAGRAPLFLCRAGWHAGQAGLRRACAARAPRGGRYRLGRAGRAVNPKKLRPISQLFDCPPIDQDMRRFVDWVASYTLFAAGLVARMVSARSGRLRSRTAASGDQASCPASRIAITDARAPRDGIRREWPCLDALGAGACSSTSLTVIDGLEGRRACFEAVEIPPPPLVAATRPPPMRRHRFRRTKRLPPIALKERAGAGAFSVT